MSTATPQTGPQPAEDDPESLVGRTIQGRYRVDTLLGTGGMGAVYRVTLLGIDKPMALKMLSQKMMQNPRVLARFEREAKAAANFGDPHVAAATDYGRTEDGRYYLVLEYIEGKELRQVLDEAKGPLPPSRALYIARQIAQALSRAHKLGIVHRDLKPENIMLVRREDEDDFVKVLDFGLALISRHLNSASEEEEQSAKTVPKITQVGEIFGTPSYMAPEQAVSGTTDTRTDLYALGINLYEMLTGVRPFVGKGAMALIQQQLVTPPPPMQQRVPGLVVPADVERLVIRLLAKQPEDRFQTPDDLIAAIDQIAATQGFPWVKGSSSAYAALPSAAATGSESRSTKLTQHLASDRSPLLGRLQRLTTRLLTKPRPEAEHQDWLARLQARLNRHPHLSRLPPLRLLLSGAGVLLVLLVILLFRLC